jgi:hypothetical protein
MSDLQSQLADLLKAGVGDPPRHVTVQAVRRHRARRRAIAIAGAAAAIAVVVAVSAGLSGQFGNTGPAPAATGSATPVPCRSGWSVTAGPVPTGDRWDRLVAIAGSASDDIWAVGDRLPDSRHVFPLLEHWDGRQWTYSAGASLSGRQAYLTSVAALSADDAWTVGYFASVGANPPTPLIEHWNGRSWSLQPTHALARLKTALPQTLTSVTAIAPGDVWVLGTPGSDSSDVYLHWNGTTWRVLRGPQISPHFGTAAMQMIAADHRGHLWAAGGWMRGYGEGAVPGGGTIERWNGRQWQVNRLTAWRKPLTWLYPVARDDVWAITGGNFTTAGTYGISPIQVLHWNGKTWKVQLSLGNTSSADLTGVAAASADDAYVTGHYATTKHPFIKHWDGTRWRNIPLGPTRQMHGLGSVGVTVTSDGSIAALDAEGLTAQANLLWFRCAR